MEAQHLETYERFKTKLKAQLVHLLDPNSSNAHGLQTDREALQTEMRQMVQALLSESRGVSLSARDQEQLIHETINEVVGLGPLDDLLSDPTITEIMINGPHEIFVERDGHLHRITAKFRDTYHLMTVIERMLDTVGLAVNESEPVCDASLPDGSRINIIIPPLVLNGPTVTIRRKLRDWTMQDYITLGSLSEHAAQFFEACVKAKINLVISGGTSTGKTTLVSILSAYIPPDHRIVTIENVAELDLQGREHWVRLVARPPNLQGRGEIPLRILVKNALRMRPDRLILGEARGGEALDVVQAMHSGHDGVMTVLHANTPAAALERLETLMLMSGLDLSPDVCRMQIASAVDLVIHLARFADGSRRVASISQVIGRIPDAFQLEELFTFEVKRFTQEGKLEGNLRYTGIRPKFLHKFQLNNVAVPDWIGS